MVGRRSRNFGGQHRRGIKDILRGRVGRYNRIYDDLEMTTDGGGQRRFVNDNHSPQADSTKADRKRPLSVKVKKTKVNSPKRAQREECSTRVLRDRPQPKDDNMSPKRAQREESSTRVLRDRPQPKDDNTKDEKPIKHKQIHDTWNRIAIKQGQRWGGTVTSAKNEIIKVLSNYIDQQFTPFLFKFSGHGDAVFFLKDNDISEAIQKANRRIVKPKSRKKMLIIVSKANKPYGIGTNNKVWTNRKTRNLIKKKKKPRSLDRIWCCKCEKHFVVNACKMHPLVFVMDNEAAQYGLPNYARESCPSVIAVGDSDIEGKGIWTQKPLEPGTVFGPFQGIERTEETTEESGYEWTIIKGDGSGSKFIDGEMTEYGNWMRFVNHGDKSFVNLLAYQWKEEIFYMVTKSIGRGFELFLHYGDDYEQHLLSKSSLVKPKWVTETARASSSVHKCKCCNCAFSSESYLHEHMKRFHLNHHYKCPHCQSTFTRKENLNVHIRDIHGDGPVKPRVCHICQKAFPSPSYLTMHIRVHTGEKPFKCNTCGQGFKQKIHRTQHERIHSGHEPFACQMCAKTFKVLCNLKDHQRIHTGQKPYKCIFCDYRTNHSSFINVHMRRTHSGKVQ